MNFKRVLYYLYILSFTLISFEVLLRVFQINQTWAEETGGTFMSYYGQKHDTWLYTWQPNSEFEYHSSGFSYPYKINSIGLREREAFLSDTPARRIICIGDSYTEGVGAPYDSTYPRCLERLLKASGHDVEIYNAGRAGSDPFYEYMLYRDKLVHLKANYLIVQINQSDINDYIYRGGFERFKKNGGTEYNKAPRYLSAYEHSYIARFFFNTFPCQMRNDMFFSEDDFRDKYTPQAMGAIAVAIDSFAALAGRHQCTLLVVSMPIASDVAYDSPDNSLYEKEFALLEKRLDSSGIMNINLWPSLKKKINENNISTISWIVDAHYNSTGYSMVSMSLLDEIQTKYPDFWN